MPTTVDPDGGKILSVMGGNYRVLVSGHQTGGAFSSIEMLVPPQNGPGPHSHADFFESFISLMVKWKFILKEARIPREKGLLS